MIEEPIYSVEIHEVSSPLNPTVPPKYVATVKAHTKQKDANGFYSTKDLREFASLVPQRAFELAGAWLIEHLRSN